MSKETLTNPESMMPDVSPKLRDFELENDQQDLNEQLLSKSEVGPFLVDAYRSAVETDPRMAEIVIVPIEDANDTRHGYASSKESKGNETGQHEVHIRLNDIDAVLAKYEQAMLDAPEAIKIIAEQLDLPVEQVTPQLLYVQSILHEMGHLTEHMDAEKSGNPRAGIELRKKEMAAMPLGALAVGKLANPNSDESKWFENEWQRQAQRHGVLTKEDLLDLQSRAYRNLTSERIADNFAADVFDINPQLKDKFVHGNLDEIISFSEMAKSLETEQSLADELTPEQQQRLRWQEYANAAVEVLEHRGVTPDQAQEEADQLTQGLTGRIKEIHEKAAQEGRELTDSEKGLAAGLRQTIDVQKRILAVFLARRS